MCSYSLTVIYEFSLYEFKRHLDFSELEGFLLTLTSTLLFSLYYHITLLLHYFILSQL